jgi:ankyrin repeat protein
MLILLLHLQASATETPTVCDTLLSSSPSASTITAALEAGADASETCTWTTTIPWVMSMEGALLTAATGGLAAIFGMGQRKTRHRSSRAIELAVSYGALDVTSALLAGNPSFPSDIVATAVHSGHYDLVPTLIERGASPHITRVEEPLSTSVKDLNRAKEAGVRLEQVTWVMHAERMMTDVDLLTAFLDAGLPLETAADEFGDDGSWAVAEVMLQRAGAQSELAATLFDNAADAGRTELMASFLEAGAPSIGVLHAAIDGRERETVGKLIELGLDPNQGNDRGQTALRRAADLSDNGIFFDLLDAGANPNDTSAATELIEEGHYAALDKLLSMGLKPSAGMVCTSIDEDDEEAFQRLVEAGAPMVSAAKGASPLQEAISTRDRAWIHRVLDAGAPLSVPDLPAAWYDLKKDPELGDELLDLGFPPSKKMFMDAVLTGTPERVACLLSHGADANAADTFNSGLTQAVRREGDAGLEMARLLLEAGADPVQKPHIHTPLELALQAGRRPMVELLVKHGASIDVQGRMGRSALGDAIYENNESDVRWLLAIGASPSGSGAGSPVLLALERASDTNIVTQLLEAGADASAVSRMDEGAVMLAIENGRSDLIMALAEHGASVSSDSYIRDPMRKARHEAPDAIQPLLDAGAPLDGATMQYWLNKCDEDAVRHNEALWRQVAKRDLSKLRRKYAKDCPDSLKDFLKS